ncbi:MAG: hypothetical protein Q9178_001394 [Gyalolechia marmorata]
MLFLFIRIISILAIFLSCSIAHPTFSPLNDVIRSHPSNLIPARNPPSSSPDQLAHTSILNPRFEPPPNTQGLSSSPDPSDLFTLLSPTRTEYHLTITSYHPFLANGTDSKSSANSASASLLPFYNSIAALISDFTGRNEEKKKEIAFGGSRLWLNFYAWGDAVLEWKDLAWCAEWWRQAVKRGLVGKWDGILWPPGEGKGIRVELRLFERLRGEGA